MRGPALLLALATAVVAADTEIPGAPFAEESWMVWLVSAAPPIFTLGLFLVPLATIRRIQRLKQTGGSLPFPFFAQVANCLIWTVYGLYLQSRTVIVPNAVGLALGVYFVYVFRQHTTESLSVFYMGISLLLSWVLGGLLCLEAQQAGHLVGLTGATASVVMLASPLAGIRIVLATRSTRTMPFEVTALVCITSFSWFVFGKYVAADMFIWVPNLLGFLAGCGQLSLFAKFGFSRDVESVTPMVAV